MESAEVQGIKQVYHDLLSQNQESLGLMLEVNKELLSRVTSLSDQLAEAKKLNMDTIEKLKADTEFLLAEYGITNMPIPKKKENPLAIVPDKEIEADEP